MVFFARPDRGHCLILWKQDYQNYPVSKQTAVTSCDRQPQPNWSPAFYPPPLTLTLTLFPFFSFSLFLPFFSFHPTFRYQGVCPWFIAICFHSSIFLPFSSFCWFFTSPDFLVSLFQKACQVTSSPFSFSAFLPFRSVGAPTVDITAISPLFTRLFLQGLSDSRYFWSGLVVTHLFCFLCSSVFHCQAFPATSYS